MRDLGGLPRLARRTPLRTFVLYPALMLIVELLARRGRPRVQPMFAPLMLWGYLQYRLCGTYRIRHGGGGPGLETPPERLVATGPYAYARNPMYLGHLVYLSGWSLALRSFFGAALTAAVALWFHRRVLADERRLAERLGEDYVSYLGRVKRWIPGVF